MLMGAGGRHADIVQQAQVEHEAGLLARLPSVSAQWP
jgi:hypothetical protein